MSAASRFIDTSVLVCILSADQSKADLAESVIATGGIVNVQVLNEFAALAIRKLGMPIPEVREALSVVRSVCDVTSLTQETHDLGLSICERYRLSVYDSMIVAAAILAGCSELASEDLQHGQKFESRLKVMNPFR